jgi:hypothetical protein
MEIIQMIKAIFQFFLRLLGIGEQAALDHASEALPDENVYITLDNTLVDPPFSFNAELHAEIEKKEDLERVLRFIQLCEMAGYLAEEIDSSHYMFDAGTNERRADRAEQLLLMNDYVDELQSLIGDFHLEDITNSGAWSEYSSILSNEQDIADEWAWNAHKDDVLLHAFYPDKYEEPAPKAPELYRVEDLATADWPR